MASPEEDTPVLESKALADHLDGVSEDLSSLSVSAREVPRSVPRRGEELRNIPISEAIECVAEGGGGRDGGDMSQSYHEIFDSQGYLGGHSRDSSSSLDTPGSVETVQVYYSEGEGRLVSVSPDNSQPPMSQYLTRKLISDTLMWQETFRNDSPSPEDPAGGGGGSSQEKPVSLEPEARRGVEVLEVLDPRLINDIEREARKLATELDCLVETLACALQSMSGLTVEHVQTYRDGVCKTCDQVDTNIRAMYQLMAKTGNDLAVFI